VLAGIAFFGIVGTLIYLLMLAQKLLFGKPSEGAPPVEDIRPREYAILVPLALAVVVLGFYPALITGPIQSPVNDLVSNYPGIRDAFTALGGGLL